jgi:hypothetical protein
VKFRGELSDLELIVSMSRTLLFVLSDNVFESEWCMKELVAAVRNGVKVVFVLKESAKWPDKQGNHILNFPPPWLISVKVPAEAQPAFLSKAISHNSDYYAAFAKDLLQRIDAQQVQIDSLRGDVAAAAAAAASPAGSGAVANDGRNVAQHGVLRLDAEILWTATPLHTAAAPCFQRLISRKTHHHDFHLVMIGRVHR